MPSQQPKGTIIYQAYGKNEIHYECLFSILTLIPFLPPNHNIQLLIFTDVPQMFQKLKELPNCPPFYIELLSSELIQEWQGNPPFVHRLKIKLLQFCLHHYDPIGNLLYLDTDTVFRKSPMPLFDLINEKHFIMHQKEGIINQEINPVFKKLHRFLKKRGYSIFLNGKSIFIPPTTAMWNAGVIGIPPSSETLLNEVLTLTDAIYPLYPKHIVEQFAFSFSFQKHGTIISAEDVIFHYWNFKEFRKTLHSLFTFLFQKGDLTLFYSLYPHIQPWKLIQAKLEYEASPGWKRLLQRLKGKKWTLPELDFEKLL